MEPLKGKTALITGAAKRIGAATALALADEGVNVIIHYNRSEEDAGKLAGQLAERGVRSWLLRADFEEPDAHAGLIARAKQLAGEIHILVNNASVFPKHRLMELTFEQFVADLRVNAWAPFELCRQFAGEFKSGRIVNMLDSRLRGFDREHVAYIASKQVLELFTRMLAMELAPNITVNAVAPGLVLPPPGEDAAYLQKLVSTVPLKKHGEARDVAEAIVYLLKSTFLTGQIIYVDGGRHIREYDYGSNPH
jgi:NAD(P)-dependent dehydrogenase (short-subunit alcohol dehydrogenase family)